MGENHALVTSAGNLTIASAVPADADAILDVLNEAARWLTDRGIDQWTPGMFDRSLVLEAIDGGEIYVVRRSSDVVATVALSWDDTLTWGERPDDAGYVHDLAIRRMIGGQRVGRALLDWAGETAAAAGKDFIRLDCDARNQALNDYYLLAGFTYRGSTLSPYSRTPVSLYERPAVQGRPDSSGSPGV